MTLDDEFRGPAAVTVTYFFVYYVFMFLQLNTRSAAVKRAKADGRSVESFKGAPVPRDNHAIMGDRVFHNTLEQMGVFLASLWMCAACVSSSLATILGALALAFRVLMPFFWAVGPGGAWNLLVEASTVPYYACVCSMLGAVGYWAFAGVNIADLPGWQTTLACVGGFAGIFLPAMFTGRVVARLTYREGTALSVALT